MNAIEGTIHATLDRNPALIMSDAFAGELLAMVWAASGIRAARAAPVDQISADSDRHALLLRLHDLVHADTTLQRNPIRASDAASTIAVAAHSGAGGGDRRVFCSMAFLVPGL